MSNLANRIEKLESKIGTKEEVILIHRVIRDMPNDARGEPTHYLVSGKVYPNDKNINAVILLIAKSSRRSCHLLAALKLKRSKSAMSTMHWPTSELGVITLSTQSNFDFTQFPLDTRLLYIARHSATPDVIAQKLPGT